MRKLKIAIFSLTSCEGCQFVLLDLGQKFFNFLKKVELVDFSLIEEKKFPKKVWLEMIVRTSSEFSGPTWKEIELHKEPQDETRFPEVRMHERRCLQ